MVIGHVGQQYCPINEDTHATLAHNPSYTVTVSEEKQ